jgi:hypothetical protein
MLTLDETTLFYYNSTFHSVLATDGIKKWASGISKANKSVASGTSSSSASATSTQVVNGLSGTKAKSLKASHVQSAIQIDDYKGAVSDLDETTGPEQQAVKNCPSKKGQRSTSAVSIDQGLLLLDYSYN